MPRQLIKAVSRRRLGATSSRLLQAREHIFLEGDVKRHVYQVEKGSVSLQDVEGRSAPNLRFRLYRGSYWLGSGGRACHQRAGHHFDAAALPAGQSAARIGAARPKVGMQLYQALSEQLLAARDLVLTVGQRKPRERVAALLVAMSWRDERTGADPMRIILPMTRADIADFLSLSIETVSRTFTKLRHSGLIDLKQSSLLLIRDRRELERLAAGEAKSTSERSRRGRGARSRP